MKFYLNTVIKFLMIGFDERRLKNALMICGVLLTDISVFIIAGLMLAAVGDIRATAILIVAMFCATAASFFCRRLFSPQLRSIADIALIRKKSEKSAMPDKAVLHTALREIGCRKAAMTESINAALNLILSVIVILCISPIAGLISAAVTAFCIYISGRKTESIQKAVGRLAASIRTTTYDDALDEIADEKMNDEDNELYLRNEVAEAESETKSLLHITGIVGWTVSCFVPIILGQSLPQCVTASVMQLYFVWQTHILADTFSDISIITYHLNKIDNME